MPTDRKRVCYKEIHCVRVEHLHIPKHLLGHRLIGHLHKVLADTYVFTQTYDNRVMRHVAYRQCVSRYIAMHAVCGKFEKHPSPDGHYTRYRDMP